ncbi:mCG146134, partial [Mus musculus]
SFSKNVTNVLSIQEDLDRHLEQWIDTFYDTTQIIREEVQSLKVRSHLKCHAKYQWICVTSKVYNGSHYSWEIFQRHLQGIWHNSNTSLDILAFHSEFMNLKNAALLSFDAADITGKIIHGLKSVFPSWSSFKNDIYGLIMLALLVLGISYSCTSC